MVEDAILCIRDVQAQQRLLCHSFSRCTQDHFQLPTERLFALLFHC